MAITRRKFTNDFTYNIFIYLVLRIIIFKKESGELTFFFIAEEGGNRVSITASNIVRISSNIVQIRLQPRIDLSRVNPKYVLTNIELEEVFKKRHIQRCFLFFNSTFTTAHLYCRSVWLSVIMVTIKKNIHAITKARRVVVAGGGTCL